MAAARNGGGRHALDPWLTAILLLCFALRAWHALALRSHPLFDHPAVDAGVYVAAARSVLEGGSFTIWQGPLYVYFLAGLLWIEDSLLFVRLVQALVATCSCWILYALAVRRAGRSVARAAGLGFALYGALIYFDGELLAEVLFLFLGLASIALLEWAQRSQRAAGYVAGGFALGLAALTRGTILPLAAFLLAWIGLEGRGGKPGPVAAGALMLLGLALPLTINARHNLRAHGEPILTSSAGGINLYVGNNERSEETMRIRPGAEWNVLAWAAQRERYESSGQLSPGEESAWYAERVLDYARRDPLGLLAGLGRKLARTAGGEEIPRNLDPYEARQHSPVLRALLWRGPPWLPFGLVLPLALCGAWMRRTSWRQDLPLLGFALCTLAVCVVYFPTGRYRAPLAPVALFTAAFATNAWWIALRARRWRSALPSLAAAVALGVLCNSNPLRLAIPTAGELAFHTGDRDLARGDLAGAERHFREAAQARGGYADPQYGLALVHARRGQVAAARAELDLALQELPDFAEAHALRGDLERATGNFAAAVESYRAALAVKPTDARARIELARALVEQGAVGAALWELRLVLRDRRAPAAAWTLNGECSERMGRAAEAIESYARAVALDPRQVRAQRALGRLLLERGELERAKQHLSAALALDPTDAETRSLLGSP